jgi:hypothetical protein
MWLCRTRTVAVETLWDHWTPIWVFAAWRVSFTFTAGRDDVQAFIMVVHTNPLRQMEVMLISVSLQRGFLQTMIMVDLLGSTRSTARHRPAPHSKKKSS